MELIITESYRRKCRDRISRLPNHVAHHILSFLTARELAQLSVTSKKNRELCISLPFLAFDGTPYKTSSVKRLQFLNYMDRFLALRRGKEIRRILIRWSFENAKPGEEYRLLTWLHNAMGCKVGLLDLEFMPHKERVLILPFHAFFCESLMKLKVNLHGGSIIFPSTSQFSMLQSLHLEGVTVLDWTFGVWISCVCKQLKKLYLQMYGTKNIIIKSSCLLELTIINKSSLCTTSISADNLKFLYLDWMFDSFIGKSLNICAPRLGYFQWQGYLVNSYSLENLENLEKAAIGLTPHLPDRNGISSNQNLFELLNSIHSIKVLHLHAGFIKVLFQQGCLSATTLNHLHELHISTGSLDDDLVPAIACLLKSTWNLQNLSISNNDCFGEMMATLPSKGYGFTLGYWESQNLEFIHQLKDATIELFLRGDTELELIKYLLKHAEVLEKITIMYSPPFPSEISREIIGYEKASTATIVFSPKVY